MKDPILILHGWGSMVSGEKRFGEVKRILEKKGYTVFTPDLPGFGKNTLKKEELFFDDYVSFVNKFIQKHTLKQVILVGHSFGGRIAIRFAALYPHLVDKLILVSASGIPRPLPSAKKKVVYLVTKFTKPFFSVPPFSFFHKYLRKLVYHTIGEMDYYKAGNLSKTFTNIVSVDISSDLSKIIAPTLIVWGENDTMTPLEDGKLMNKCIARSSLVSVPQEGHKFPYEKPELFVRIILDWLQ